MMLMMRINTSPQKPYSMDTGCLNNCYALMKSLTGNIAFICYWLIYNLLLDQFEHFFLWKVARSSTSTDSPFFCINQLINGGELTRVIT